MAAEKVYTHGPLPLVKGVAAGALPLPVPPADALKIPCSVNLFPPPQETSPPGRQTRFSFPASPQRPIQPSFLLAEKGAFPGTRGNFPDMGFKYAGMRCLYMRQHRHPYRCALNKRKRPWEGNYPLSGNHPSLLANKKTTK